LSFFIFLFNKALENEEILNIDTEKSILYLGQSRQFCLMLEKAQLYYSKTMTTGPYV